MRCEEVRGRLDEWVEGALGERQKEAVAAHLAGCDDCRAEARALEALLAAAADLPREIRPPRELWAGIDARLSDEPSPMVVPLAARRGPRCLVSPIVPAPRRARWAAGPPPTATIAITSLAAVMSNPVSRG